MPRNNRGRGKKREEHPELNLEALNKGLKRFETKGRIEFTVQSVSGNTIDGEKEWKCPHCSTVIRQGTAHLVAWETHRGPDSRRHFHTPCWRAWQGNLF